MNSQSTHTDKFESSDFFTTFFLLKNSDTVYIIGGGPSLLEIDRELLKDKDIICCNNAFKIFPTSLTTIFADNEWYEWNKKELLTYSGLTVTTCNYYNELIPYWKENRIYFINTKLTENRDGISFDKNLILGKDTGHQAINLAILCGYKNIVLCGFDMDSSNKTTNWHTEHKTEPKPQIYDEYMIQGMNSIPEAIKDRNVKIFNINFNSKIKCFDFIKLEDTLKWE